ncbi:MAG TPA: NTP transferase domain-containing protein [Bacteroidales bacterium]|nr:NTP transferase domain-containing protein [Bacteroidales bacterium]HPS17430.1 NTP transferase domain-containing protein [Bacteroidales bacterium]
MSENDNKISSSVVILAAGLSERMGKMKPLLSFNNNKTFLEQIISQYQKFNSSEIVVVTNNYVNENLKLSVYKNVKIIINHTPSLGRMSSIILGINALTEKKCCFIHNVDNPFVNIDLLEKLQLFINDENYVTPVYNDKGGHPILIGKNALEKISVQKIEDADLREIFKPFKRKNVQTDDEKILYNINTIDEYKKYFHF